LREAVGFFRYQSFNVRKAVFLTVARYGLEARPALIDGLKDADPNVVEASLLVLGSVDRDAGTTIQWQDIASILTFADNKERRLRVAAFRSLGFMGGAISRQALLARLEHSDRNTRNQIIAELALTRDTSLVFPIINALKKISGEDTFELQDVPSHVSFLLNPAWIAGNLENPDIQRLAYRFGYIDEFIYELLPSTENDSEEMGVVRRLMSSMFGIATESLFRGLAEAESPTAGTFLVNDWESRFVRFGWSFLPEMEDSYKITPVAAGNSLEARIDRDILFAALRFQDTSNVEVKADASVFEKIQQEIMFAKFVYFRPQIFDLLYRRATEKADAIFKEDPALKNAFLPYFITDWMLTQCEIQDDPAKETILKFEARWRSAVKIFRAEGDKIFVKSGYEEAVCSDCPFDRKGESAGEVVNKLVLDRARVLWKYTILDPEWRSLSNGSRSALRLYAYDLFSGAPDEEAFVEKAWKDELVEISEEERFCPEILPSVGFETQSANVPHEKTFSWKSALSYFDIPSPDRQEYRSILEVAMNPSRSPRACILAISILHRMGIHENYGMASAFHLSVGSELGAEAKYIGILLRGFMRREEVIEDRTRRYERLRRLMSKGRIAHHTDSLSVAEGEEPPKAHTELRVTNLADLPDDSGELDPAYRVFIPATRYVSAALAAHVKKVAGGEISELEERLSEIWIEYRRETEDLFTQEKYQSARLLDADWYESTGDIEDIQFVAELEIIKILEEIHEFLHDRPELRQELVDLSQKLYLKYGDLVRETIETFSEETSNATDEQGMEPGMSEEQFTYLVGFATVAKFRKFLTELGLARTYAESNSRWSVLLRFLDEETAPLMSESMWLQMLAESIDRRWARSEKWQRYERNFRYEMRHAIQDMHGAGITLLRREDHIFDPGPGFYEEIAKYTKWLLGIMMNRAAELVKSGEGIPEIVTNLTDAEWEKLLLVQYIRWNFFKPIGSHALPAYWPSPRGVLTASPMLRAAELQKEAGVNSESNILDLGCGVGHPDAVAASLFDASSTGYDIHPTCIELGQDWTRALAQGAPGLVKPGQIKLIKGDYRSAPLDDFTHLYAFPAGEEHRLELDKWIVDQDVAPGVKLIVLCDEDLKGDEDVRAMWPLLAADSRWKFKSLPNLRGIIFERQTNEGPRATDEQGMEPDEQIVEDIFEILYKKNEFGIQMAGSTPTSFPSFGYLPVPLTIYPGLPEKFSRYFRPFLLGRADGDLAGYREFISTDEPGAQKEREVLIERLSALPTSGRKSELWIERQGRYVQAALERKIGRLIPDRSGKYDLYLYFGGIGDGLEIRWCLNRIKDLLDLMPDLRNNLRVHIICGDIMPTLLYVTEQGFEHGPVPYNFDLDIEFEWIDLTDPDQLKRLKQYDIDCFFLMHTLYLHESGPAGRRWQEVKYMAAMEDIIDSLAPTSILMVENVEGGQEDDLTLWISDDDLFNHDRLRLLSTVDLLSVSSKEWTGIFEKVAGPSDSPKATDEQGVEPSDEAVISSETIDAPPSETVTVLEYEYTVALFKEDSIRYLQSCGVTDCILVTLWDKVSQTGVIAHIPTILVDIPGSFSEIFGGLRSSGVNIEGMVATIIGGNDETPQELFTAIEGELGSAGISNIQKATNTGKRESAVLDLKDGRVYKVKDELKVLTSSKRRLQHLLSTGKFINLKEPFNLLYLAPIVDSIHEQQDDELTGKATDEQGVEPETQKRDLVLQLPSYTFLDAYIEPTADDRISPIGPIGQTRRILLNGGEIRSIADIFVDLETGEVRAKTPGEELENIRKAIEMYFGLEAWSAHARLGGYKAAWPENCRQYTGTLAHYIHFLQDRGLFRFHKLYGYAAAPAFAEHIAIAVAQSAERDVKDREADDVFVIDAWVRKYGEPIVIEPFETWKRHFTGYLLYHRITPDFGSLKRQDMVASGKVSREEAMPSPAYNRVADKYYAASERWRDEVWKDSAATDEQGVEPDEFEVIKMRKIMSLDEIEAVSAKYDPSNKGISPNTHYLSCAHIWHTIYGIREAVFRKGRSADVSFREDLAGANIAFTGGSPKILLEALSMEGLQDIDRLYIMDANMYILKAWDEELLKLREEGVKLPKEIYGYCINALEIPDELNGVMDLVMDYGVFDSTYFTDRHLWQVATQIEKILKPGAIYSTDSVEEFGIDKFSSRMIQLEHSHDNALLLKQKSASKATDEQGVEPGQENEREELLAQAEKMIEEAIARGKDLYVAQLDINDAGGWIHIWNREWLSTVVDKIYGQIQETARAHEVVTWQEGPVDRDEIDFVFPASMTKEDVLKFLEEILRIIPGPEPHYGWGDRNLSATIVLQHLGGIDAFSGRSHDTPPTAASRLTDDLATYFRDNMERLKDEHNKDRVDKIIDLTPEYGIDTPASPADDKTKATDEQGVEPGEKARATDAIYRGNPVSQMETETIIALLGGGIRKFSADRTGAITCNREYLMLADELSRRLAEERVPRPANFKERYERLRLERERLDPERRATAKMAEAIRTGLISETKQRGLSVYERLLGIKIVDELEDRYQTLVREGVIRWGEPMDVLDLGCGGGLFLKELLAALDARSKTTGMLFSLFGTALKKSDEWGDLDSRITVTEGNILEMPVEWSGKFHYVLSVHMFEYLQDPIMALEETHRILSPHGKAIIHNLSHTPSGYIGGWEAFFARAVQFGGWGLRTQSFSSPHHPRLIIEMGGISEPPLLFPYSMDAKGQYYLLELDRGESTPATDEQGVEPEVQPVMRPSYISDTAAGLYNMTTYDTSVRTEPCAVGVVVEAEDGEDINIVLQERFASVIERAFGNRVNLKMRTDRGIAEYEWKGVTYLAYVDDGSESPENLDRIERFRSRILELQRSGEVKRENTFVWMLSNDDRKKGKDYIDSLHDIAYLAGLRGQYMPISWQMFAGPLFADYIAAINAGKEDGENRETLIEMIIESIGMMEKIPEDSERLAKLRKKLNSIEPGEIDELDKLFNGLNLILNLPDMVPEIPTLDKYRRTDKEVLTAL
jgi:SAM-dependent methyltransferase